MVPRTEQTPQPRDQAPALEGAFGARAGAIGGKPPISDAQIDAIQVPHTPRAVLILIGRMQPVHEGHLDLILRLLRGDPTLAVNEVDRDKLSKFQGADLVVGLAEKRVSAENPWSVGERRRMLEYAFQQPVFKAYRQRLHVESVPDENHPGTEALRLFARLPFPRELPLLLASGNSKTIAAYDDGRVFDYIHVRNRNSTSEISATQVRKLLFEERFAELTNRGFLTADHLGFMIEQGMVRRLSLALVDS